MSVSRTRAPSLERITTTAFRSNAAPDRLMRRIFGITELNQKSGQGAHRAFRIAVLVTAIRCLITYLAVPILVPLLSLSGWVAAPVGIVLCIVAVINGIIAVRRFWISDHRYRWVYTLFMGIVFVILAVALYTEIHRWVVIT